MALREHVTCGGQFWRKKGYTLDDTMGGEEEKVIWGKTILKGVI